MTENVVVYDNNPLVIAGLDYFLSQQNFKVVSVTSNPDELFHYIVCTRPDFIIIDPILMKESYLARLSQLESTHSDIKIIIFASSESAYHILRSAGLNWMAYINKDQPLEKLIDVLRHPPLENGSPLNVYNDLAPAPKDELKVLSHLTGREMQVLREIGAGKTNKIIAKEMNLSNKTISTYKRNIMDKFKTHDVRDVIDFARRHGF